MDHPRHPPGRRPGHSAARLVLEISLTPDRVAGTITAENGAVMRFDGWLELVSAVAASVRGDAGASDATVPDGPPLLG
jgi:hypothetical protein